MPNNDPAVRGRFAFPTMPWEHQWQPVGLVLLLVPLVWVGWAWLVPIAALWTFGRIYLRRRAFRTRLAAELGLVDKGSRGDLVRRVEDLLHRDGCTDVAVVPRDDTQEVHLRAVLANGKPIVVHCMRHIGANTIDRPDIRRISQAAGPPGAGAGVRLVVTSNRATQAATDLALSRNIGLVQREALGLWILRQPPLRALHAPRPPGAGMRAPHLLRPSGYGGDRLAWLTIPAAIIVLGFAGGGPAFVVLALGLTFAAVLNGSEAHLNPDPPPPAAAWLPLWAEAAAAPAIGAFGAWLVLILSVL